MGRVYTGKNLRKRASTFSGSAPQVANARILFMLSAICGQPFVDSSLDVRGAPGCESAFRGPTFRTRSSLFWGAICYRWAPRTGCTTTRRWPGRSRAPSFSRVGWGATLCTVTLKLAACAHSFETEECGLSFESHAGGGAGRAAVPPSAMPLHRAPLNSQIPEFGFEKWANESAAF